MRTLNNYCFFYGGFMSQWFPSKFIYKDIEFETAEHAMMWEKAMTFGDNDIAQQILATKEPYVAKQLGRKVRNYDDSKWDSIRIARVIDISMCKFLSNPRLKDALINTNDLILVEASPSDKIWGIGLSLNSRPEILTNPNNWNGQNLLGKALMVTRLLLNQPNTPECQSCGLASKLTGTYFSCNKCKNIIDNETIKS